MLSHLASFTPYFINGTFSPHIQEEYLVNGILDIPYISFKLKIPCSRKMGNEMVNTLFGGIKFVTTEHINEVSFREFQTIYSFGVYPNVRGWISHIFDVTGKVLTKEMLFNYLMKTKN